MDSGGAGAGLILVLLIGGAWIAQPESSDELDDALFEEVRGGETYPEYDFRRDTVTVDSYGGFGCTEDCSGHEAGYDWAEERQISNPDDCDGNSWSFIEGCRSYAEGLDRDAFADVGGSFRSRGGMVIGGPLDGSIMPGPDGGMVIGGPLEGSIMPGRDGGMVIGGPLDGSLLPGEDGGIIIGGPLDGAIVPAE